MNEQGQILASRSVPHCHHLSLPNRETPQGLRDIRGILSKDRGKKTKFIEYLLMPGHGLHKLYSQHFILTHAREMKEEMSPAI